MNQATAMIERITDADNELSEARYALSQYLYPLIKDAGLGHPHGTIIQTNQYKEYLEITCESFSRGCGNTHDYRIPNHLLNASDPAAAAAFKETEEKRKAAEKRASTLAHIEYLQQSLKDPS
jgi:hypothetical protein